MSSYTPGPWTAGARTVSAPETEDRLALTVQINGGNRDDNRANARLIAAAPDLLEALQAVLGADAGCLCGHFESCSNCSPSPRMRKAREKARTAIAKATGRTA